MITTKVFVVDAVCEYRTSGWWPFKGAERVSWSDNPSAEAQEEFDRQINEASRQLGRIVQILDYKKIEWGGCLNEYDEAVDHHCQITATVVFQKSAD